MESARILLVDDDPTVLEAAKVSLRGKHELLTAECAEDALQILASLRVDVIATDHFMPGMNGLELLQKVQTIQPNAVRVMFTGYPNTGQVIEAFNTCHIFQFILKPFQPHTLRHAIQQAIEHAWLKRTNAHYQDELERANRGLEERVRERTAELEQKLSEIAALNERLRDMASRDPGTDLYNRRFFFDNVEREWSRAKRQGEYAAVILVDLDHFKRINDEHGHLVGDRVIADVARLLERRLRDVDLLARYGGEEYIVALVTPSLENLKQITARIHQDFQNYLLKGERGEPVQVTASIGVACCDPRRMEAGFKVRDLIRISDEALYEVKGRGRNQTNCYFVEPRGARTPLRSVLCPAS